MEPQVMTTFQASVSARSYELLLNIVIMTRRLIIFRSKTIQAFLTSWKTFLTSTSEISRTAFIQYFEVQIKKQTRHVEPTSHQNTRSCEVFQLTNPSSDLEILTDINRLYIYFSFLCPWINSNFAVSKMQGYRSWLLKIAGTQPGRFCCLIM